MQFVHHKMFIQKVKQALADSPLFPVCFPNKPSRMSIANNKSHYHQVIFLFLSRDTSLLLLFHIIPRPHLCCRSLLRSLGHSACPAAGNEPRVRMWSYLQNLVLLAGDGRRYKDEVLLGVWCQHLGE